MSEQVTQQAAAATPVEGGSQTAPTGQAQGSATGGQSELEARLAQERDAIRREYEAKGGKMAKLQAENARLKRLEADRMAQRSTQATQLIQTNPAQAAQILAEQNAALLQERYESTQERQVTEWANRVATNLGLEEMAPEQVLEIARETGVGAKQGAEFDMQQRIAQTAVEAANKRAADAQKKLAEFEASLPDRVKGEVARLLSAAGLTPDTSATQPRGSREPQDEFADASPMTVWTTTLRREREAEGKK